MGMMWRTGGHFTRMAGWNQLCGVATVRQHQPHKIGMHCEGVAGRQMAILPDPDHVQER